MSTSQSYATHSNPAEIYGSRSGLDYLGDYSSTPGTPSAIGDDDRVAPSILRRNNRRARRRFLALTPDEEYTGRSTCEDKDREDRREYEDREDRAPWRVAAASQVETMREELLALRTENEKLKEQLRETKEETNDLRRELRKAKSILQRSRKVTIRYRGESIQDFLKDVRDCC